MLFDSLLFVVSLDEESTETRESLVSMMLPGERCICCGELCAKEDWFELLLCGT